jgi:superfamily II DNA helicase RecQ
VEKSPARSNICYVFSYIDKNLELETVFKDLIIELKQYKHKSRRTIIFCQTRKQCSVLYRMFCLALGNDLLIPGRKDPKLRIIDMFHAGSPNSVKEHVIKEMGLVGSHLRIIICMIAFGMGINCKDTYSSIHFGPPKNVEFFVQESGRIGLVNITVVFLLH